MQDGFIISLKLANEILDYILESNGSGRRIVHLTDGLRSLKPYIKEVTKQEDKKEE